MIITIDGVAASGKSSVAGQVAQSLGVPFVSSGLLYRAATWLAQHSGLELSQAAPIVQALTTEQVRLEARAEGNRVWQGQYEITDHLHSSAVDSGVSVVAALPEVREWVNAQLRELRPPFVAEGRDMGTAVFPQAEVKFYLTASPRVRAQRRSSERPEETAAIEAALVRRDALDQRQSAPAADATLLDTSDMTLDEVIAHILARVQTHKK